MNELITVKTNKQGKQVISAKNLYDGLGLNRSEWSRWYKTNIEKNEFFKENIDWVGFIIAQNRGGKPIQDFAISLEFAKHIAMMARTEKSHKYRNYFIKCEKKIKEIKQLSPMEQLRVQYQVIEQHEEKLNQVESKVTILENNMTIDYSQQLELNELAKKKVVAILGGKDAPAYKELNKKAFSQIWKDYKRIVQVNSYRNTAIKDLNFGRKVIVDWNPSRELELMIKGCNSQLRM